MPIHQQEKIRRMFDRKIHKSTMKKADKALKIIEQINIETKNP